MGCDPLARQGRREVVGRYLAHRKTRRAIAEELKVPLHPLGVVFRKEVGLLGLARQSDVPAQRAVYPRGAGALRTDADKVGKANGRRPSANRWQAGVRQVIGFAASARARAAFAPLCPVDSRSNFCPLKLRSEYR